MDVVVEMTWVVEKHVAEELAAVILQWAYHILAVGLADFPVVIMKIPSALRCKFRRSNNLW